MRYSAAFFLSVMIASLASAKPIQTTHWDFSYEDHNPTRSFFKPVMVPDSSAECQHAPGGRCLTKEEMGQSKGHNLLVSVEVQEVTV